jgi:hypothetical protein
MRVDVHGAPGGGGARRLGENIRQEKDAERDTTLLTPLSQIGGGLTTAGRLLFKGRPAAGEGCARVLVHDNASAAVTSS